MNMALPGVFVAGPATLVHRGPLHGCARRWDRSVGWRPGGWVDPHAQLSSSPHACRRLYTCVVLETASARATLQARAASLRPAPNSSASTRQLVLHELAVVAGLVSMTLEEQDEPAALAALAKPLYNPAAAPLLPLLVHRLLPPAQLAGSSQAGAPAPAACGGGGAPC